jgi:hypothetical protein
MGVLGSTSLGTKYCWMPSTRSNIFYFSHLPQFNANIFFLCNFCDSNLILRKQALSWEFLGKEIFVHCFVFIELFLLWKCHCIYSKV